MKKRNKLIFWAILFSFFVLVVTTDISAQRTNEERSINLTKDARKNGYKTWEKDGFYYFQANNVVDPEKEKLLEGLHDLSYLCGSENALNRIRIELSRGSTQRIVVACAVLNEPKIILMDEPLPY